MDVHVTDDMLVEIMTMAATPLGWRAYFAGDARTFHTEILARNWVSRLLAYRLVSKRWCWVATLELSIWHIAASALETRSIHAPQAWIDAFWPDLRLTYRFDVLPYHRFAIAAAKRRAANIGAEIESVECDAKNAEKQVNMWKDEMQSQKKIARAAIALHKHENRVRREIVRDNKRKREDADREISSMERSERRRRRNIFRS